MSDDRAEAPTGQPEEGLREQVSELIRRSGESIADAERHVADSVDRLNECRDLLDRTSGEGAAGNSNTPDGHAKSQER